jgi:LacI family transcriptional regulator/LacI family asc operon transcriptional repressor
MTIYDIAKKCNVSIATVSRVLNGSDRVSDKTRAKVLAAMEEQEYAPNPFARGLGLDSMKMIGVLCSDVADAFYAKAVSIIENELRQQRFDVMLSCTGTNDTNDITALRYLMNKHVDGIIIIGTPFVPQGNRNHLRKIAKEIPIITLNNDLQIPGTYSIVCDEQEGMRLAVQSLAEQGHRSILYLYDSLTYSGTHKLKGYQQGVLALGLDQEPALIQRLPRTFGDVERTIHDLLQQGITFDAILTSEDLLAVAAQRTIYRSGLKLPVIGCNNSILAECATPTLTSLDNQLNSLCETAIQTIIKITAEPGSALPAKTIFSAQLVERESFQSKD